ncbi:hypothetical protein RB195_013155 [Necator americanus]|uniref:CNH domain-containing protein n=1 Tax=Necator americanus TaxID=51031 RepID=A0ABR1DVF8_NECAM
MLEKPALYLVYGVENELQCLFVTDTCSLKILCVKAAKKVKFLKILALGGAYMLLTWRIEENDPFEMSNGLYEWNHT